MSFLAPALRPLVATRGSRHKGRCLVKGVSSQRWGVEVVRVGVWVGTLCAGVRNTWLLY